MNKKPHLLGPQEARVGFCIPLMSERITDQGHSLLSKWSVLRQKRDPGCGGDPRRHLMRPPPKALQWTTLKEKAKPSSWHRVNVS